MILESPFSFPLNSLKRKPAQAPPQLCGESGKVH
jgi:hypothetical protein